MLALLFILLFPLLAFAQGAAVSGPQANPSCEDQLATVTRYAQNLQQRGSTDLLNASHLSVQVEKLQADIQRLQGELDKVKESKTKDAS